MCYFVKDVFGQFLKWKQQDTRAQIFAWWFDKAHPFFCLYSCDCDHHSIQLDEQNIISLFILSGGRFFFHCSNIVAPCSKQSWLINWLANQWPALVKESNLTNQTAVSFGHIVNVAEDFTRHDLPSTLKKKYFRNVSMMSCRYGERYFAMWLNVHYERPVT